MPRSMLVVCVQLARANQPGLLRVQAVPAMTPRQLALLQDAASADLAASMTRNTTVVESVIRDPSAK
jgi:hypothetical protein